MPPGLFITLLLLIAVFYKKSRVPIVVVAISLYLLSTKYIGNALLVPFEKDYYQVQKSDAIDAVIILSGGHDNASKNLPLTNGAFKRAIYGVMLAKKENLPIIFSGAGRKVYNESDAMKDTVFQLNEYLDINLQHSQKIIPNSFTISYENSSLDTYENASFTKELFSKSDIKNPKIYLVTSAFHMKRAKKLYEYFGFDVIPAATDFRTTNEHTFSSYIPSITGLTLSYFALHEYAGLALLSFKLK